MCQIFLLAGAGRNYISAMSVTRLIEQEVTKGEEKHKTNMCVLFDV